MRARSVTRSLSSHLVSIGLNSGELHFWQSIVPGTNEHVLVRWLGHEFNKDHTITSDSPQVSDYKDSYLTLLICSMLILWVKFCWSILPDVILVIGFWRWSSASKFDIIWSTARTQSPARVGQCDKMSSTRCLVQILKASFDHWVSVRLRFVMVGNL